VYVIRDEAAAVGLRVKNYKLCRRSFAAHGAKGITAQVNAPTICINARRISIHHHLLQYRFLNGWIAKGQLNAILHDRLVHPGNTCGTDFNALTPIVNLQALFFEGIGSLAIP
jgi:hypothetical protein